MAQPKQSGSLIGKISSYLQIVSKDPRSTAFVPLAEAYRQIGLLDDALEAARMGTGMLPHFSPGFATLGRIYGQMGRIDEAMSAYARALSIDRQSQSALVGLARLHLVRGERDLARRILQQAAEFHPQDEMVENMLVALDLPRPWIEAEPAAEPEPLAAPVAAAAEADRPPVEEAGAPIPTITLAEIYLKQGLPDKAIKVYTEISRLQPDNQDVRRRLAELSGNSPPPVRPEPREATPSPAGPAPAVSTAIPPVPLSPLAVFERWLSAIQARRAHVQ